MIKKSQLQIQNHNHYNNIKRIKKKENFQSKSGRKGKKKRKKIPNQRMGESKKEESTWSKKPEDMCRITPLAHLPNSKEKARVEFQASMNEL